MSLAIVVVAVTIAIGPMLFLIAWFIWLAANGEPLPSVSPGGGGG